MKLLHSPSCSSSSSFSTSTFDANLCNPKGATPGCLAGILRRILCSGSLPTHPSDQITEEANSVKSDDRLLQVMDTSAKAKPTAGIVARLMGLDSMPEMNVSPNLISRSQSMNSVDHLFKHLESQHRRVRSTLSFREMPTFLELENEDFFILSFEEERGSAELRAKQRRSEMGCAEFKQRREEKCKDRGSNKTELLSERRMRRKKKKKKKIDTEEAKEYVLIDLREKKKSSKKISDKPTQKVGKDGRAKISTTCPILSRERHENLQVGSVAEKAINGKKSTKNVESECSSDESSPVSVLDCSQFLRDPDVPLSGDSSSSPIHPRRKLSPELETFQNPSPRNDDNLIINERKVPKTKEGCEQDKWEEEICRITETELAESNWKNSRIWQEREDEGIFAGFESCILDGLIDEFVEQMYDLPLIEELEAVNFEL